MLDAIKRKELDADLATLEVGDLNLSTYEKLMVLKLVQFIDNLEKSTTHSEQPKQRAQAYSASSGSEFTQAIAGKDMNDVIQVIDELMDTLKTINGRAYASVMRKVNAL